MVALAPITNALWATLLALVTITVDRPVVTDGSSVSPADRERIAQELVALRERTGVQMAVVFLDQSIGAEPIEDFSHRTAVAWRGGEAGRDNGLLLTFALADRKMRLEVGYGLEAAIPDEDAREMLDDVRPQLRSRQYADAASSVIQAVSSRIGPGGTGRRPVWLFRIARRREGFLLVSILALLTGAAFALFTQLSRARNDSLRSAVNAGVWGLAPIVVALALTRDWAWDLAIAWTFLAVTAMSYGITAMWLTWSVAPAACALAGLVIASGLLASPESFPQWNLATLVFAPLLGGVGAIVGFFPGMLIAWMTEPGGSGSGTTYSGDSSSSSSFWASSSSSSTDSSSSSSWSSSSSSDYSSSSSSSSDWSGGGGDFGGGGASSSW